ncbi:MAG: hypothetical protein AABM40_03835 [Chloroflexota bacterium]
MTAKKRSRTASGRARPKPSRTCFVMTPYGGYFDSYFNEIIRPAIESAGLEPTRADDLFRSSEIVKDIWSFVRSSTVLLADLSSKNPNVLYELGLAHAAGKPVVLISQSIDDVPFDLRALRVLVYELARPDWARDLKKRIKAGLLDAMANAELAVPATFLRERKVEGQVKVSKIDKRVLEIQQRVAALEAQPRAYGVASNVGYNTHVIPVSSHSHIGVAGGGGVAYGSAAFGGGAYGGGVGGAGGPSTFAQSPSSNVTVAPSGRVSDASIAAVSADHRAQRRNK